MLRHIAWFNEATVAPDAKGELSSPIDGVLHRCLEPARTLEKMGVACSVFGNLHDADPQHVAQHLQKLKTDIVVMCNVNDLSLFNLARMAKHLGCYVVVDFGAVPIVPSVEEKFSALADMIVTADDAVAAPLRQKSVPTVVIPDCNKDHTPEMIACLWLECFKKLKTKPPLCANSNLPHDENA